MHVWPFLLILGSVCMTATIPSLAAAEVTSATDGPVVYYDMTSLETLNLADPARLRRYYDETHLVTSLQGLANRDAPRLFVRYNRQLDDFWWARMTETGGWLEGRPVEHATGIPDLLARFAAFYQGAVVWDERVPATSNVASTLAGCDDLLCLRYDTAPGSLYHELVVDATRLSVAVRLMQDDGSPLFTGSGTVPGTNVPSMGSAKCDAYVWLIEHYVKTGKANPHRMGYYLDAFWLQRWNVVSRNLHTLNNHDFVIARRGVLFDLGVWDDEVPVDDPGQAPGTDVATLKRLLQAAYDRFEGDGTIHVAGFVPWAYKYTNWGVAGGTHEPVPTEWRYAEIISSFNGFMDADAIGLSSMPNASFYQHYPLEERYPQEAVPTREALIARGVLDASGRIVPRRYVAHYVGDYDAAAWLYQAMPDRWTDPARGQETLSWAFNPNLCERFPLGMAWTRATRTANDVFVAGDCGAGYLNPGHLQAPRIYSGLTSGVAAWEAHCRPFFEQWDISLVGFIIDGYAPCMRREAMDAYSRIAPDGIVPQKVPTRGVHQGMPYLRMNYDLPDDAAQAAAVVQDRIGGPLPQFQVFRSILKWPSWYVDVNNRVRAALGDEVLFVDLYTLLWLVRAYETESGHPFVTDSPFAEAGTLSATPLEQKGLATVSASDGPVTPVWQEGVRCWRMAHNRYLYFNADEGFRRFADQPPLEVEVHYWDGGTGAFWVQYDGDNFNAGGCGIYTDGDRAVRTGSSEWRVKRFGIPDMRLRNSQNHGADFRLYNTGAEFYVREVVLRRSQAPGVQVR